MEIPESMSAELRAWNGGAGIDLQTWIGCMGNFAQAIGYASLLWPEFKLLDGHLVRADTAADTVRGCANQPDADRRSTEALINHLHLAYIHSSNDCTTDKLLALGKVLQETYEARLARQFPDRPCTVSLSIPDDPNELEGYVLTFWQNDSKFTLTHSPAVHEEQSKNEQQHP